MKFIKDYISFWIKCLAIYGTLHMLSMVLSFDSFFGKMYLYLISLSALAASIFAPAAAKMIKKYGTK